MKNLIIILVVAASIVAILYATGVLDVAREVLAHLFDGLSVLQ